MFKARYSFGLVAVVAAIVFAGVSRPVTTQSADSQAIMKRLDALEASQRAIQQQLQEIKGLLQARPAAAPAAAAPVEILQGVETQVANAALRGQATARFVFIEYSDFQCPFCARYARDVAAPIIQEFVDSGKMKYAFKHFPLNIHPFAPKAAEASECAREQGKFWEMHDELFANQQALGEVDLMKYALSVGVDRTRFQLCLNGSTMAPKVRADTAEGVRLGVVSTPTFFVGQLEADGKVKLVRKITGAQPLTTFKAALQSALATPAK